MGDLKVGQAKWQRAWSIYLTTNQETKEGKRVIITPSLYNQCMEDIESPLRTRTSATSTVFCRDFWEALKGDVS